MMLIIFEFFDQVFSIALANSFTTPSRLVMSEILDVLIFLMETISSLMNVDSSSLSLMIVHLLELICSLTIGMTIVRDV